MRIWRYYDLPERTGNFLIPYRNRASLEEVAGRDFNTEAKATNQGPVVQKQVSLTLG